MPTRFDTAALDVAARRRLIRVARREEPADLILRNARLLNVYTGEILPGTDIAIAGERFAVVGDASGCAGPNTELVDLEGRFVSPGFVDAHYHIESAHLTPLRHAEVTLPQGTTTIVIDPHEACASGGIEAIRYLLEASEGLPQKVYVQISSATPPSAVETVGAWIGGPEAEKALAWPRVVGLGEVMDPQRVFSGDERIWELLEFALANNQVIEGHGGYLGHDLDAYAAIGVQDSHSPRTADQALEMLRRGFEIQLKVKRSTAIVERFLEVGIDWGRVGLAVDDRPVDELVEIGGIDNELREAIRLGVPTVAAYRMATLNNARHWHYERDHGGIAPGRFADVVVLSDLESVAIDAVYASGREWARDGRLVREMTERPTPVYALGTVRLARPVTAADFRVEAPTDAGGVVAAAGVFAPPAFYTGRDVASWMVELPVVDGSLPGGPGGVSKVGVVERHRATGNVSVGFQRWGVTVGAIASSMMHDSHNIVVVGADDADMAMAVNQVAAQDGGMAVVRDGRVLAAVALPVWGLMSDAPVPETLAAMQAVEAAGLELCNATPEIRATLGQWSERIVDAITFGFLTCHPRQFVLTDQGWFDMADQSPMALPVG